MFDTFGNKVKIKKSPATLEKGLADKIGVIFGHSRPSIMDFEVIGAPKGDFIVNVYFDDLNISYWFDEDLLEFVDYGEGYTITLDGVDKKWTKSKNGDWIEDNLTTAQTGSPIQQSNLGNTSERKKWWRFWK